MTRLVPGPQISGVVYSKQTGAPLAGITVTPSAALYTTPEFTTPVSTLTTDGEGGFAAYAQPGVYTFTISDSSGVIPEPVEVRSPDQGTSPSATAAGMTAAIAAEVSRSNAAYAPKTTIYVENYATTARDGTTDNTVDIDAASLAARNVGGALQFGFGPYVYSGAGLYGHAIRGRGHESTIVNLAAGVSLFVSPGGGTPTSSTIIDIDGIQTNGGFGLVRLAYTGTDSSPDRFRVENFVVRNHTGAAISSLASDMAYWKIKGVVWSNGAQGTMGVALAGYTDACDIDIDAYGVQIPVKLGRGGDNAKVTGSAVFSNAYTSFPRMSIWVVPETVASNSGNGLLINHFRFGNENYSAANDYRLVYADESSGSGTDFATRTPAMGTASAGFISGHMLSDSVVVGNGTTANGPVVFSTTPNVRGCRWAGSLSSILPGYIVQFLSAPAADPSSDTNIVGPWVTPNRVSLAGSCVACSAPGLVNVIDPDGTFSRDAGTPAAYPVGDNTGINQLVTANFASLATVTTTPVTDAGGGTDACEVTYPSKSTSVALFQVIASVQVGVPLWFELDIEAGSSSSLTDVQVVLRYSSGTVHFNEYLPVTSSWVRHRLRMTPRESASALQALVYNHNETTGKVRVGRTRIYQSREPVNVLSTAVATDATGHVASTVLPVSAQASTLTRAGLAETFPRWAPTTGLALSSGQMQLAAIPLTKGMVVAKIAFFSGSTALATGSNQWFALYNPGATTLLGITADDTSTAWGANAQKQLTLASPYTVTADGLYWVACMVNATTTPTIMCLSSGSAQLFAGAGVQLNAKDTTHTGLTNPASAPAAATLSSNLNYPWAYVS